MSSPPPVVLLDTHAFLWFALGDEALSEPARRSIERASVAYFSAASAWEIATKHRLGRLAGATGIVVGLSAHLARLDLTPLPIEVGDGELAGSLGRAHRDPFDRMLAAQAIRRGLPIVSNDAALDGLGAARVW